MMLFALLGLLAAQAVPQDRAARIERFIAALPPTENAAEPIDPLDAATTADLVAAHPGKEAEIRAARGARTACMRDALVRVTAQAIRKVAEGLSDVELDQLTAFYAGPDFAAFQKDGKENFAAWAKRYPLERFAAVNETVFNDDMPDLVFVAADSCDTTTAAALARAGIKTE